MGCVGCEQGWCCTPGEFSAQGEAAEGSPWEWPHLTRICTVPYTQGSCLGVGELCGAG